MENLGLGKVLLVEDDEKLAGLIAHFLSQHGFGVRVVHRGDEALAAFSGAGGSGRPRSSTLSSGSTSSRRTTS